MHHDTPCDQEAQFGLWAAMGRQAVNKLNYVSKPSGMKHILVQRGLNNPRTI